MAEEDYTTEISIEPHVTLPKESLIHMEFHSPISKAYSYRNFEVVRPLNKGKFPVFIAKGKDNKQLFALKAFEANNEKAEKCFQNETRFSFLAHPNIVKTHYFEKDRLISYNEHEVTSSFILTELAPYGDFFRFVMTHAQYVNEKLVRTYFRQLLEGIEYLHSLNIAHLDLKLDNLLIGENYTLKIADFDLSCFVNNVIVKAKGTKYYRAPEVIKGRVKNAFAADVYSAGIILFVLLTGGRAPHMEDTLYCGIDLFDLLLNNIEEFWKRHNSIGRKKNIVFSEEFKTLFHGMTMSVPDERLTIREIKNSAWYQGETYTEEELKRYMQSFLRALN